ncbi:hypothetical protein DPMN_036982 [Dreissena polymorpha]|uniref:RING-type domain-containing protein n=1 Tax=Dreissena polymorpha TaxID=45954 RepID=A0A9D4MCL8_DREPO|nr:hypothetical protein DPMN_036982 [Dreissena polymorpha]
MSTDTDDIITIRISESVLTCQICMETFVSPRILPCQHNICKGCLLTYSWGKCVQSKSVCVEKFPCPSCRQNCRIGKIGEDMTEEKFLKRFPENRLLNELIEYRTSLKIENEEDTSKTRCSEESEFQQRRIMLYYKVLEIIMGLCVFYPRWNPEMCMFEHVRFSRESINLLLMGILNLCEKISCTVDETKENVEDLSQLVQNTFKAEKCVQGLMQKIIYIRLVARQTLFMNIDPETETSSKTTQTETFEPKAWLERLKFDRARMALVFEYVKTCVKTAINRML